MKSYQNQEANNNYSRNYFNNNNEIITQSINNEKNYTLGFDE